MKTSLPTLETPPTNSSLQVARGTFMLLASQGVAMLAGFLTMAFLTRQLGLEKYGIYAIAATVILWAKNIITLMFSKTTLKHVAETQDWKPAVGAIAQGQLWISLFVMAGIMVCAPVMASLLNTPQLTFFLLLFALEIPFFVLSQTLYFSLIGQGSFGKGFLVATSREIIRAFLTLGLVWAGLSISGAVLSNIGASLFQLGLLFFFIQVPLRKDSKLSIRWLITHNLPLLLYGLGMQLYRGVDLMVVKAVSVIPLDAGYYSIAQNMTVIPMSITAGAFSNALLSILSGLWVNKSNPQSMNTAKNISREALRLSMCLLPFLTVLAGSAGDLAGWLFGPDAAPAGPSAAWLYLSALALMLFTICITLLMSIDGPSWIFSLVLGMLLPAFLGEIWLVSIFNAVGAAIASALIAFIGTLIILRQVKQKMNICIPIRTLLRCILVGMGMYTLSAIWNTSGPWLIFEIASLTGLAVGLLVLIKEISSNDIKFIQRMTAPYLAPLKIFNREGRA